MTSFIKGKNAFQTLLDLCEKVIARSVQTIATRLGIPGMKLCVHHVNV